jgi:excisionase family DNA binding protein
MFSFDENAFKQIIREALVEVLEGFEFPKPASQKEKVEFLTVKEVEKLLKISHTTLYALIKQNRLKPIKIGRRTLFSVKDLEHLGGKNDDFDQEQK